MSRSFRSIVFMLLALLALGTSCRPGVGPTNGGGCEDDRACLDASKPYCDDGLCVQCVTTNDCNCHESCVEGSCEPLGASGSSTQLNAHGNWSGNPGTDGYT